MEINNSNDDETPDLTLMSPDLEKELEAMLGDDEEVEMSMPADMSLRGKFEPAGMFITNKRVIAFDPAHPEGVYKISLDDVIDAEVERMYGNFVFKIKTKNEGIIELNRYTSRFSLLFDDAHLLLKDTSEDESKDEKVVDVSSSSKKNRCPECGRTLPKRSSVCPFCIDTREVVSRLLSFVKPHWKMAVIGLVFSVLFTGVGLMPPYLTRILVDDVVLKGNLGLLWMIVVILVAIHLFQSLFQGLRRFILRSLGERIVFDLRTAVYKKLQSLSMDYFNKRRTGAIMSRITNDTQHLRGFLIQATQEVLVQFLTLVGIGIIMFAMDWQLALITLLPIPFVTYGAKIFARRIHPVYHRVWRRVAGLNAILGDSIPGIEVIKAFTGEEREIDRFTNQGQDLYNEQVRAARMSSMFMPTVTFLMSLGGIIIWGLGGYWVITQPERLTLGTLVAFIGYLGRFYGPIHFLANLNDMVQQATTAAERVFEILDAQPEPDYGKGKKLKDIKGAIEFRNVTFYYEKEKRALENISLLVNPGETVGLVGATGSGKTTLSNLVLRYYDPVEGQILIDGKDIKDIDLHSLRKKIGVVLQEPFLFHDTIARNIAYSKPHASTEEIIHAAKIANAHNFISKFPNAYDTRIGERGVGLSGGERQRISIARAVLKDPSLLILDEATSAVDTQTEKLIQEAINRLIEHRTTFIIAHRLSTLRNADKIVVLSDGEIAEIGSHDELMSKKGLFYKMVQMQADMGTDMLEFK